MKRLTVLFTAFSMMMLAVMAALPTGSALAGGGDCLQYNPSALYVTPEGDHWLLTDGAMRMEVLDNATDASHALAVAQRYVYQCFVGRNNNRPDHRRYVTEYYGLSSGLTTPSFSEDCIGFNPASLTIQQNGSDWFVLAGNISLSMFASQTDAQVMVNIITGNGWNRQCFIGRDNTRPDRLTYIMEYWKTASSRVIQFNPNAIQINP